MKNTKYILLGLFALMFVSCNEVLEKEYLEAINPDDVYTSPELAEAYVNNFYGGVMPGWPITAGESSDEAGRMNTQLNDFLRGTATIDSYNNWPYDRIRTINIFLENINTGTLTDAEKNPLVGQMLFWRAWLYYGMVKNYGGVPLILEPQGVDDEGIYVSRAKSSDCFTQILKDLDDAAALLPETWDGANVGRVDKITALSVKGRVALTWASPLFNTSGDNARWQAAYDANKAAVTRAQANGKGLFEDFGNIWYDELNKEVIMVRRFHNPGGTFFVGGRRPIIYSKDAAGYDQPTLELVNSFPMKDGSQYDPSSGYNTISLNRDDRFYASIAYNGSDMNLSDMRELNTFLWTYWTADGSTEKSHPSATSFYTQKGQDLDITASTVYDAAVDWVEIRYAEILMNMGEAANELGNSAEALDILSQIRSRANIEAGADNKYGVTASSKEEIREAYFDENFVEFAMEGKRWSEIRRLRKFDHLNTLGKRHGLKWNLNDGAVAPTGKDDITNSDVYNRFTVEVVETDSESINIPDSYYFFAIPKTHLERNSNLEQTQGWDNGTFDPLQ